LGESLPWSLVLTLQGNSLEVKAALIRYLPASTKTAAPDSEAASMAFWKVVVLSVLPSAIAP